MLTLRELQYLTQDLIDKGVSDTAEVAVGEDACGAFNLCAVDHATGAREFIADIRAEG